MISKSSKCFCWLWDWRGCEHEVKSNIWKAKKQKRTRKVEISVLITFPTLIYVCKVLNFLIFDSDLIAAGKLLPPLVINRFSLVSSIKNEKFNHEAPPPLPSAFMINILTSSGLRHFSEFNLFHIYSGLVFLPLWTFLK